MEEIRKLVKRLVTHEPGLYPEDCWDDTLEFRIARLDFEQEGLAGQPLSYARCVQAGLHLWNESLDASHDLSQQIPHETGSYWHGIMHRMEGDYSNAKYWFYKAGQHPIHAGLVQQVHSFLQTELATLAIDDAQMNQLLQRLAEQGDWQPDLLVDAVERQVVKLHDERAEQLLLKVQYLEINVLLDYCWAASFGGSLFDAG